MLSNEESTVTETFDLPILPEEWICRELGDLLQENGLSYGIVQPGADDPGGVPIIRVKNVRNGRVVADDVLRVAENVEAGYRRTRLKGGEVLLSLVGSVGEVAIAPSFVENWNVARAIAVIRVDDSIGSSWVKLCLSSELARRFMHIWQTTTVQATLNLRDVRRLPIVLPPRKDREAIAALFGALDDKIAVNDRIAATAHSLAQAHSARAHDSAEPAKLSEMAELTMGSSPPGESYNEEGLGMPFYQGTRDFGDRFPGRRVWCTSPVRTAPEGACLVSVRAPVGRVNIARETCCIGRGVAAVSSKQNTPSVLFHELTASSNVWLPFESEGTVFGAINKQQLATIEIPTLDAKSAQVLERVVQPLDQRVASAYDENQALSALRDTLLPKLMSGQIRVRDAEKVVEDVT